MSGHSSLRAVELFYSYSHKDAEFLEQLEEHLALLRRDGVINEWQDRMIGAGAEWERIIGDNLEKADIILLLVSASFIASDFCFGNEMRRAMERHKLGQARVVPVIIRSCDWHAAPFGKIQALPRNGKPVAGPDWFSRDQAFTDVAQGIRAAAGAILSNRRLNWADQCTALPVADSERDVPLALGSQELHRMHVGELVSTKHHSEDVSGRIIFVKKSKRDTAGCSKSAQAYRICVVCSSAELELEIARVVTLLENEGLQITGNCCTYHGEKLKKCIARSHALIPLMRASGKDGAFAEATGFARAHNVPVIPGHNLCYASIGQSVIRAIGKATYLCGREYEDRTTLINEETDAAYQLGGDFYRVRQRGGMSAFSLPDQPANHGIWNSCEGEEPDAEHGKHARTLQREERTLLAKHVEHRGCDLILSPLRELFNRGPTATITRLRILRGFLESLDDKIQVRIAFVNTYPPGNLLLVGDWFVAESTSPRIGIGYCDTFFTNHAPSVSARLDQFDEEFDQLAQQIGDCSRQAAGVSIRRYIDEIEKAGKDDESLCELLIDHILADPAPPYLQHKFVPPKLLANTIQLSGTKCLEKLLQILQDY